MSKKNIIALGIFIISGILVILLINLADTTLETSTNFIETGYITQSSPSYINDTLVFTYEEPGAPALTALLVFNEESVCVFNSQSIPCIALSNPLINIVRDRLVDIEGVMIEEGIVVTTLKIPPEDISPSSQDQ